MSDPLIAPREDSTRWYSGVFLAEDIDSLMASFSGGGWIDASIGGIAAGLDALAFVTDPLGQLVAWGVGWLIEHLKPLSDALDVLAGDPDQIAAYAKTWANVAGAIDGARIKLHDGVAGQLTDWTGSAAAAYRGRSGEYEATLAALVKANNALSEITAGAGLLVATVRMLVRDLIADFVSVLAVRLWEWLAEEGLTLGLGTPWVIAQVTSLAGKWVGRIAHLLDGLVSSLRRLTPLIRRLGQIIEDLKAALRRLTGRRGPTSRATPTCTTPTPTRSANTARPGRRTRRNGTPPCGRPRRPASR
ncbi:WXG100 family type VII secretion target [Paractinoplanes rhizophilus]|uniref:WXG100 family type VII secretion target n=1 Tax=Paractinoplanes rhizophilus TaxID=1416877 RepID=A0ABW2HYS3_9ACTN